MNPWYSITKFCISGVKSKIGKILLKFYLLVILSSNFYFGVKKDTIKNVLVVAINPTLSQNLDLFSDRNS